MTTAQSWCSRAISFSAQKSGTRSFSRAEEGSRRQFGKSSDAPAAIGVPAWITIQCLSSSGGIGNGRIWQF